MYGVAFQLFGMSVHWYGICVAVGFLTSLLLLQYKRKYAGMTSDQIFDMSLIVIIGGIAGARLFYVIQFHEQFRGNFLKIFRIDQGGLVFYGGFIVAALVIFYYIRRKKLVFSRILDICAPAMAVGHAFGRIGCLIQGCCYGMPCKSFGITYPAGSAPAARYPDMTTIVTNMKATGQAAASSLPLLPVQLFEAVGNLLLGIIALLLFKKIRKSGHIAAFYFFGYGLLRFVLEFFRGDHADTILFHLTRAQLIGLCIMLPAGAFFYFYFRKYGEDVNCDEKQSLS